MVEKKKKVKYKPQFIQVSKVKRFVHENGKRIRSDTIEVLDLRVKKMLEKAMRTCGHFKTVRPFELYFDGKKYQNGRGRG